MTGSPSGLARHAGSGVVNSYSAVRTPSTNRVRFPENFSVTVISLHSFTSQDENSSTPCRVSERDENLASDLEQHSEGGYL